MTSTCITTCGKAAPALTINTPTRRPRATIADTIVTADEAPQSVLHDAHLAVSR